MKFRTYGKKDEYRTLIISEIINSERKWLLKSLKCLASEDRSVINVLTCSKDY